MLSSADGRLESTAWLRGDGATRRIEMPVLSGVPGLVHLFTVKGSDTRGAIGEAAGRNLPLLTLRQVHGATVRVAEGTSWVTATGEAAPPEGDALVLHRPGALAGVWVADCLPVLICDATTRTVAAVHAGWRGTVAGVVTAAIDLLRDRFGADPTDLRLAMGPSIGPCCFEVGDEVVEAFLRAIPDATDCIMAGPKNRIDLVKANSRLALAAGVPGSSIQSTGLCTLCNPDLLESYRKSRGGAGRMAGIIGWRE